MKEILTDPLWWAIGASAVALLLGLSCIWIDYARPGASG